MLATFYYYQGIALSLIVLYAIIKTSHDGGRMNTRDVYVTTTLFHPDDITFSPLSPGRYHTSPPCHPGDITLFTQVISPFSPRVITLFTGSLLLRVRLRFPNKGKRVRM